METALSQYNALELAYLGDAVYELKIREYLLGLGSRSMIAHNKLGFSLVNAAAQAKAVHALADFLTPEEMDIIRYGRNAKGGSAKSASLGEYRQATGLECLLGKLYLKGETERIDEIMQQVIAELMKED